MASTKCDCCMDLPHRGSISQVKLDHAVANTCEKHRPLYIKGGWKPCKTSTKRKPTTVKKRAKPCQETRCESSSKHTLYYVRSAGDTLCAHVCDKHKASWLKCGWKPTTKKSVKESPKGKGKEVVKMQWWNILSELSQVSDRIMLVGPPGTGKSQTAFLLLEKAQRLTMTEGTAVEDLLGMFHLVEGSTVWKDGPAARAMRAGTALILDEIDKYSPEVGSLLYALLDDDPQVTLPSGEHLKAKKGYKVIATSNANVSALPEAILDRMEAVLIAAVPHPDAMGHLHQSERAAVISHYEKKVDAKVWQWTGAATLRRMRAYHKFRAGLKDLPDTIAAEAAFGKNGKEILSVLATSSRTGKEGL